MRSKAGSFGNICGGFGQKGKAEKIEKTFTGLESGTTYYLSLDILKIDSWDGERAKVDVNDEGVVTVAAPDEDSRNIAMQMIKDITAKAELNKIYSGKVMKIMEFGAFVNFLGKQDGLVHISELADKRVAKVTDVVKEGDEVKVKVIGFDRGKVKLSMKQAAE